MKLGIAVLATLVVSGSVALAQNVSTTSEHPVLVELFTSEGCSSCPPADVILGKISNMHTPAGTLIVTLSEHVTYWNHDGWTDPFSDEAYTERQKDYDFRLNVNEPYTPQVVVMGQSEVNGSKGPDIVKAVDAAKSTAAILHLASAQVDGKKVNLTFSFEGALPKKGADIYVVIADDTDTTDVKDGENKGKTISHVTVARSLKKIATLKDTDQHSSTVSLPSTMGGHHVVLIAQETGVGKVLAVETKAL